MALTKVSTPAIKDEAITLAKLLHGDSNSNGKFLRANNGADPTFETVNTDLVSDTSPQLGGTLDLNSNQINGGDSNGTSTNMIMLGASSDLKIYHDSNDSYLKHSGSGDLYIDAANGSSADIRIKAQAHIYAQVNGNETAFQAFSGGAVELYNSGYKKLETTSTGIEVTGRIITDSLTIQDDGSNEPLLNLRADDANPWAFVIGNDNNNTSTNVGLKWYVANNGNAYQHLQGNSAFEEFHLQQSDGSTTNTGIKLNTSRAVELNYQGSKKYETTSDGSTQYGNLTIPDNDAKIILKDGNNYIQFLNTDKTFKFMNAWGAGEFTFHPGGSERVRINPNGLLFNGDTSSNNALDDYEIGDWTPQMWRNGGSNEITLGSGNRYGRYIKIGDLLWVSFYWYNPSLTTSGGQYYVVRNLPFSLITGNTGAYQFISGGYLYFAGSNAGDYSGGGQYRWQANGTFTANTLTMYSDPNNTNVNGALEFSGCGVLRCA